MPLSLRRRPRPRRAAAALLAALAVCATTAAAEAQAAPRLTGLRLCDPSAARSLPDVRHLKRLFDTDARARCARLAVPLDRTGAVAGTVRLDVRILPPRRGAARETIVALAGGPGQAGAARLDAVARTFGPALRHRRLVAFDQRGTGASGPLRCPSLARERGGVDRAVADCAARLGARRTLYGTSASVADLEALRVALGAPRLTLAGSSYGTKVALDYAARHPDRVGALVLDAVVPPSGPDPFSRSTFAAMPRVLAALCRADGCPFTADPGADLAALVDRIARDGPVRGRWVDDRGRARTVAVGREHLYGLLLDGDANPFVRPGLPAAVRSALDGDPDPLARLVASTREGQDDDDGVGDALFVATACSDGPVPWPAGTPVPARAAAVDAALAALPAGALAPFDAATLRATGLALCRAWPESPLPQPSGPLPDVPALLLAGEDDLRTPVEDAAAVAALLPRARLVTAPETGHGTLSPYDDESCAARALQAFLAGRAAADCPPGRGRRALAPRPLAPARMSAVRPAPGLPPRIGRTVAAVEATYADLDYEALRAVITFMDSDWDIDDPDQRPVAWGGLRGGRATFGERTRVRRYEVVPGVRVSGEGRADEADPVVFRLRVSGPAAARGTVRVGPRRISGRLGGRRVDVAVATPPAIASPAALAARPPAVVGPALAAG